MERDIQAICEELTRFYVESSENIDRAVELIRETFSDGGRVATIGELATLHGFAEHLATDLGEVLGIGAPGEVLALPVRNVLAHDDPSQATSRLIEAFVGGGDLLVALTLRHRIGFLRDSLSLAASQGARTVVIGPLNGTTDLPIQPTVVIPVASPNVYQRIEMQLLAVHEIVARSSLGAAGTGRDAT